MATNMPETPIVKDDKDNNSDVLVQTVPRPEEDDPLEVDQGYLSASKGTKFFRGVLFQMILFGALSFVGPAMNDAISNLGGGGLSTPYLANLASSLTYASACLTTLFGGPLINKIGIKWSCIIAAIGMPFGGSGYYASARFKADAYLLFARVFGGITGGFLYVAETTAMLSYPHMNDRGFYLGIWSAMRNSGSVIGGAINFSTNYSQATAGGIDWSTYLIFVGFECTGLIWAGLLSQTRRVRRSDGTIVPNTDSSTWKGEFTALWKHAQHKRTWLIFFPAFYSFFYGGVLGTYLSLTFSVRSRALSSLITPSVTIVMVMLYGRFVLDNARFSQKTRGWLAFLFWLIPQVACFIWFGVLYARFAAFGRPTYDYGTDINGWAQAYFPYLIFFSTGYWCQLSMYWILGTFSSNVSSASRTGGLFRAFETLGQAISYGINANTVDKYVPMYIMAGLCALSIPSMVYLIRLIPEKPTTVDDVAEEQAAKEAVAVQAKTVSQPV